MLRTNSRLFIWLLLSVGLLNCASLSAQTHVTENGSGQHEDLYYLFWQDSGDATMTLLEGGRYQSQWQTTTNNWVGGLGVAPVSPSVIRYSGGYSAAQGTVAFVSLFGSSTEPQFEFYVIESFSEWNPSSGGTYYGSYETDGVLYDAYYQWSIVGGVNGQQRHTYHSVRRNIQPPGDISGTITVDNHVNAWAQMGVDLSTLDFMVLATEAYRGEGHSDFNVASTYGCGPTGQLSQCCSTASATGVDGVGAYFDGKSCLISTDTEGWHPENPNGVIAAINVGGLLNAVQNDGVWYAPNTYVSGGVSRAARVQTTEGQASQIYQSAQQGEISLAIPVHGASLVSIELGFVDLFGGPAGANVFDLIVEGKERLSAVDVYSAAGGYRLWSPEPIVAEVTDETLNIDIIPIAGQGTLSSVLVKSLDIEPLQITANERGFFADKYFTYWSSDPSLVANLTLLDSNKFSTDWTVDSGQWFAGMGWKPGLESSLEYSGYFNPEDDGDAYLGLMGWTENPQVPFYIIESWVGNIPGFTEYRTLIGSYESGGAQYDLYRVTEHPDSIEGGYPSYFSVRKFAQPTGLVAGRINTARHFNAWRELGVSLGAIDTMLLVTEATSGAGNASLKIEEGSLTCGVRYGVPNCCDISADPDGDGWGTLQDGRQCAVTDATHGWHPSNPDSVIAAYNLGTDDPPIEEGGVWFTRYPSASCDAYYYNKVSADPSGNAVHKSGCSGNASLSITGIESRWVAVELTFFEADYRNDDFPRAMDIVIEGEAWMQDVAIHEYVDLHMLWRPYREIVEVTGGQLDIDIVTENPNMQLTSVLVTEAEAPQSSSAQSTSSSSSDLGSSSSSATGQSQSAGMLGLWALALLSLMLRSPWRQRREVAYES